MLLTERRGRVERNFAEWREKKIRKLVMILILVLSVLSVPILPSPARAFSCPTSHGQLKIDGCVVNGDTGNSVSGLIVFIISCGIYQKIADVTTDSNGYFSFQSDSNTICIGTSSAYLVTVNGVAPIAGCNPLPQPCDLLGSAAYDLTWGQWAGDVQTDSSGYGSKVIQLTPARTVIVPAASLYSNTQFVTLDYEMQATYSVSHSISIQVSGASVSFDQSFGMTYTQAFTVPPNMSEYVGEPWYVIGYYCAGSTSEQQYANWTCSQGLIDAGLSEAVPNTTWGTYSASEYLSPGSLSGYCNTTQQPGSHTISYTQTAGTSATLGISGSATLFGSTIGLTYSATVSSGTSDTIKLTIDNPTTIARTFRVYFASGSCSNPTSELHVWEYPSLPPDFSVSSSPSSLSVTQGSTGSSTPVSISVQAINGFANSVALSASSNDPSIQLTLSPTSVNPAGAAVSSSLTVNDPAPTDCGSYTITVIGQSGQITHSVSIPIIVTSGSCFSISASPSSVSVPVGTNGYSTISVNSFNSFSGTVTLSTTVSQQGLNCGLSPTSLSGSGSSTLTCAGSLGSYSVTVTGTSGPLTHSVTLTFVVVNSDFTISVPYTTYQMSTKSQVTETISLNSVGSFTGSVSLVAPLTSCPPNNCAQGPGGGAIPPSVTLTAGSGTSTLVISSGYAMGTFVITLAGTCSSGCTSQAQSHSIQIFVNVSSNY